MAKEFTKIPSDAFQTIQTNAGVLLKDFTPSKTATIDPANIICATTGGVNFTDVPTYTDYGEDIDNCPVNMKELKRLKSHEVKLAGTAVTISETMFEALVGPHSKSGSDVINIKPSNALTIEDFEDAIWWVGDYAEDGFVAIELKNALNTAGFALQTNNDGKGNAAFEFTGHYSMDAQDEVPYNLYICKTKSA